MSPAMGILGTMCYDRRMDLGLSLRAVGELAGISFMTVRDIERERIKHPTGDTMKGLSTALDLPIAVLALASYGVSAAR